MPAVDPCRFPGSLGRNGGVGSGLGSSGVQTNHLVAQVQRLRAVGNDEHGAISTEGTKCSMHASLTLCIETLGRFVEQQYALSAGNGAGEGYESALASRQRSPTRPNQLLLET